MYDENIAAHGFKWYPDHSKSFNICEVYKRKLKQQEKQQSEEHRYQQQRDAFYEEKASTEFAPVDKADQKHMAKMAKQKLSK